MCLVNRNSEVVPDSQERASLILAGLGLQFDNYSEWSEIYDEVLFQYLKLKESGGFELLQEGEGGGKRLQMIACPPKRYTVSYLHAVVYHATVYIRLLQRDTSLELSAKEVRTCATKFNYNYLSLDIPVHVCRIYGEMLNMWRHDSYLHV